MIVDNNDDSYHLEDTKKFLPKDEDYNNNMTSKQKFAGLTKEEVLAYSTDPAWVKLRWILFSLFWLVWLALIGAVIGIVVLSPKCPPRPQMNWWQKEIVYQVDVQKFRDSDGDGTGDIAGLLSKISYFKDLGFDTVCLNSNILNADAPKEFQAKLQDDRSHKDLKKEFKQNDMHVILDLPFETLKVDESLLRFWLTSFADGVRVTNVPVDADRELLQKWLDITEQVGDDTFETKFLAFDKFATPVAEAAGGTNTYTNPSTIQQPLFSKNIYTSTAEIKTFLLKLQESYNDFGQKIWPSYFTSEYQTERISRLINNKKQLQVTHGLLLLLKGTPFLMYGDELELSKTDEFMRWDSSVNCGFSSNTSLSVGSCENSVQDSSSHGAGQNLIRMYEKLAMLRKEPSFSWGDIKIEIEKTENIVSFVREAEGFEGYLVAANVNKKSGSTDFKTLHNIPKNATVSYFYSDNESSSNEFSVGLEVFTERIILKPGELLVVKFDNRVKSVLA